MKPLVLPLMMYGKHRGYWHIKDRPLRKKVKVGETVYKSGKKKGKKKPVYEWQTVFQKKKVVTGYDGYFQRGKNKGKPKPIYEKRSIPKPSAGFYPSENCIFMTTFGGARRLTTMAEKKMMEWKELAIDWAVGEWEMKRKPQKVIAFMTFYFPDNKVRDTHNAKKLLLDALEGVIHENDMYIVDRTMDFHVGDENPRIELTFKEL